MAYGYINMSFNGFFSQFPLNYNNLQISEKMMNQHRLLKSTLQGDATDNEGIWGTADTHIKTVKSLLGRLIGYLHGRNYAVVQSWSWGRIITLFPPSPPPPLITAVGKSMPLSLALKKRKLTEVKALRLAQLQPENLRVIP